MNCFPSLFFNTFIYMINVNKQQLSPSYYFLQSDNITIKVSPSSIATGIMATFQRYISLFSYSYTYYQLFQVIDYFISVSSFDQDQSRKYVCPEFVLRRHKIN